MRVYFFGIALLSWLIYSRPAPWISFQAEAFAYGIFFMVALWMIMRRNAPIERFPFSGVALALLAVSAGLSYASVTSLIANVHLAVFHLAALLGAFWMGYLSVQRVSHHEQPSATEWQKLASLVVVAGLVTGAFGLVQWSGWIDYSTSILSWLMPAPVAGRIMGNIGQANLFALSIAYGLFFTVYLFHARQISVGTALVVALYFAVIIGLTQSRAILLGLVAASALVALKRLDLRIASVLYISTAIACGIALFGNTFLAFVNPSAGVRAVTEPAGITIRLELWKELFLVAWSDPFRADGLGGTIVRYFDVLPILQLGNEVHFSYAHNLYIDLIVWLNPIMGTVVFGLLLYFLGVITYRVKGHHVYLWLPMVVIATHSMFEFPYAYFSLAFIPALIAGYLTHVYCRKSPQVMSRSAVLPAFLATALFGSWIAYDYTKIYGSYLAVQIERRFHTKPSEEELNPRVTWLRDWSEHLQFARGDHASGCQRLVDKTDTEVRRMIMLHPSPFAIQRVLTCSTVSEAEKAYWRVRYPEL